ncbi:MFS transporter [Fodinicola acaciae]|uniref:MFS transporter n=1 Tax=Fodinicola acaciae TaxID=2681555 RepID=UPI0013D7DF49|nr:MFS transporter [Fodinicola acaciae]
MSVSGVPQEAPTEATPSADRRQRRRAVLAAAVGTLLEYYDYYLYGLASAVVFPKLFFPSGDPVVSQLLSFATFAVGFILRPLGGIVLGHIADRVGRRPVLIFTIVTMGIASTLIGLLPTYAQIGVLAPILLIVLRLVQGFSTGGEIGGAASLAVENAPPRRRGLYGSLLLAGAGVALFVSSGLMNGASALPGDAFLTWAWRVPFLLSVVLLVGGLLIRRGVHETPVFTANKDKSRAPLLEVLRRPRMWVFGILFGFANSIGGYVLTVYGPSYLQGRHVSATVALSAVQVASAFEIVLAPTWGWLSDRYGRRPMFLVPCVGLAVLIFPIFWLWNTGNPVLVFAGMVLGFSVCVIGMSALSQTILSELFSTSARTTGISVGYQFTAVFAGGFAPLIATAIGTAPGVAVYLIIACVLSAVAMLLLPERSRADLATID